MSALKKKKLVILLLILMTFRDLLLSRHITEIKDFKDLRKNGSLLEAYTKHIFKETADNINMKLARNSCCSRLISFLNKYRQIDESKSKDNSNDNKVAGKSSFLKKHSKLL